MRRSPKDTLESTRTVSRRGLILGGGMLGFMGLLGLRMRFLQVEQQEKWTLLSDDNRIKIQHLVPARGLIFDRNGLVLAENEPNYRVVILGDNAGDSDQVLANLADLLQLTPEDIERARQSIARDRLAPVTIADRLTWQEFAEIAVNAPALPGVETQVGLSRIYPYDQDMAHVVGYVGPVSDYDLTRGYLTDDPDPLLKISRFQVGKNGVEARLEHNLRGKAGTKQEEVNAAGRVMRELNRQEGTSGAALQLTVESKLQNYTLVRLLADEASRSASAVVMDVENGDILAMASGPSFDPNKFVRGISTADYQALQDEELRPQFNKAAQGVYPPGSTFKMITALAALEDGVIDAAEEVFCPGFRELGDRKFRCWNRGGHGDMNLIDSLRESCDVYYYDIAERVGIDKISAMARRLGLGQKFELPLLAVHPGLTPTRAWKPVNQGEAWLVGDTLNSGIGQGFVLASPLQLAVMTARLASGRAIQPRLVKTIDGREPPLAPAPQLGISTKNLKLMRQGMYDVVNKRNGTAYSSRIVADGLRMAGKTGTSQVRALPQDPNAEIPWKFRDHSLFVAYAPYDKPKIAVSLVVEHGGSGGLAAAPAARDIMLRALYDGPAPLAAYPASQRNRISSFQKKLALRDPQSFSNDRSRS